MSDQPGVRAPFNGTAVFGPPRFDEQTTYADPSGVGPDTVEPEAVRWDLSIGACLSYGRTEPGGPLVVNLGLSDHALRTGVVRRIVTREQLIAHASHLLRLAGTQDGVETLIRRAIADPRQFCDRRRHRHDSSEPWDYETIPAWGARAVMIALGAAESETVGG